MIKSKIKAIMGHYAPPTIHSYLPHETDDSCVTITYWDDSAYPSPFYRQSLRRDKYVTIVIETYRDLEGAYYTRQFVTGETPLKIVEFVFDGRQFLAKCSDGRIISIRSITQKTRQFKKSY